ncbi:AraC family transcriptional regulator [Corallococcus exercitus]|uniref:helix-turn-helix domain-containing protein n=1 Tax=Corallococcus exercitus TaxID=2316736 RepID=UPI000EA23403|nr:AraC family transcriptional regulator [Corallococcus exercitus]RKG82451.1 AraC family transcriptional regulator [Corallococcus exercitus]
MPGDIAPGRDPVLAQRVVHPANRDARPQRALERIVVEDADALRVKDLVEAASLCRAPFLRAFRASMGESPTRYLQGYRLARAAERLRQGQAASVLATARMCGFGDPAASPGPSVPASAARPASTSRHGREGRQEFVNPSCLEVLREAPHLAERWWARRCA